MTLIFSEHNQRGPNPRKRGGGRWCKKFTLIANTPWACTPQMLKRYVLLFVLFSTPLPLRTAAIFLTPPNMTEFPSPTTIGHTGAKSVCV